MMTNHKIILTLIGLLLFSGVAYASIQPSAVLKSYFTNGSTPDEDDFIDLIDSTFVGTSTNGYVLQTNGSGWSWVATSSLGITSFSTSSADSWANGSTTVAKTYSANTFTGLNTFNATTTFSTSTTKRLGVGTTTPATELDVYGTTTTRFLVVDDGTTTGTTTVSIGNPKIGKLCLWNGENYTMLWFNSNSTSTQLATSTNCI